VKFPNGLEQLPTDRTVRRVYGEPYQTPDGSTVIPVARSRRRQSEQEGPEALGVFVVHGGKASWVPAVDTNRIALIGVITGLLAAVIGSLAVLRQPPWPRITITDYR
jgi:hypothetical protein